MHNGQIGGFEAARKAADMLIQDAPYRHRRSATDSDAFFCVGQQVATDPIGAIARTIATFEALSTKTPKFRMTSVFSDGEILYAVRYASDGVAPTLYHRWSTLQKGRAVVSEPFDAACGLWQEVPDKSFCVFERQRVQITTL